jgi:tetratricopeptide (TPR) repeat protein
MPGASNGDARRKPEMRDQLLGAELDRALQDQAVRVVTVAAPTGEGRSMLLQRFEVACRERQIVVDRLRLDVASGFPGAGIDAWLRSRLAIPPGLTGDGLDGALGAALAKTERSSGAYFGMMLGRVRGLASKVRLDEHSHWEAATAELERWLFASRQPFVALFDDAQCIDHETLAFVELIGARQPEGPALIVLALRSDELDSSLARRLERGVAERRAVQRQLPPLLERELSQMFSAPIARAAGGSLRSAQLLAAGLASAPEAWGQRLEAQLSDGARATLAVLRLAGGRLPAAALASALELAQVQRWVDELERAQLLSRGPTRRFPGDEEVLVRWKRHASDSSAESDERAPVWMAALGQWADAARRAAGEDWPDQAPLVLPLLIRSLALEADQTTSSLGWEALHRVTGSVEALVSAEAAAIGIRKVVLGCRLAEIETARARPRQALECVQRAAQSARGPAPALRDGWDVSVFGGTEDPFEQWNQLTFDEALMTLELAELEALVGFAPPDEVRRAAERLRDRLWPATGRLDRSLRLRWASAYVGFLLDRGADVEAARAVCAQVRAHGDSSPQQGDRWAQVFLCAEQSTAERCADPPRALALADERITLAKALGDRPEECEAWIARGRACHRNAALDEARAAFEVASGLARGLAHRSREAAAWHSLGLVQCQAGQYAHAQDCQQRYLSIVDAHGSSEARARGHGALALAQFCNLDYDSAEVSLARARRAAEDRGHPALRAWVRLLAGQLRALEHLRAPDALSLSRARNDLMASAELIEEHRLGWTEALDPAEVFATLALCWRLSGQGGKAKAAVARGEPFATASAASARWLAATWETLGARRPEEALAWYEANHFRRAVELWAHVLHGLGLVPTVPV